MGTYHSATPCKSGCIYKRYHKDTNIDDRIFKNSIRESSIFIRPILLILSIHDNRSFIHKYVLNETIRIIIDILIQLLVKERIDVSLSRGLKYPWSSEYRVIDGKGIIILLPPLVCVYTNHKACITYIQNNGNIYEIPNYFFVDDVYYSDICKCPEYYHESELIRTLII